MSSGSWPFQKTLTELTAPDLAALKEVSEGWYVEYKSTGLSTKTLAKALSAFANQYGGWLFLGIASGDQNRAQAFPGIDNSEISQLLNHLTNASKDCIQPEVFYEVSVLSGPCVELELQEGRSVVAVYVPAGAETPY